MCGRFSGNKENLEMCHQTWYPTLYIWKFNTISDISCCIEYLEKGAYMMFIPLS